LGSVTWQFEKMGAGWLNLVTSSTIPWAPSARSATVNLWRMRLPSSNFVPGIFSAEANELRLSVLELFVARFEKRFRRRLNRACTLLPALLALRATSFGSSPVSALFNFSLYPVVYKHRTTGRFRHAGVRYKYRMLRVR
jgi:hypothetical protein